MDWECNVYAVPKYHIYFRTLLCANTVMLRENKDERLKNIINACHRSLEK
jgi:hypothetical protein